MSREPLSPRARHACARRLLIPFVVLGLTLASLTACAPPDNLDLSTLQELTQNVAPQEQAATQDAETGVDDSSPIAEADDTQDEYVAEVSSSVAVSAPVSTAALQYVPTTASAVSGNVTLYNAESWDAASVANIQQALALLPDWVKTQLGNPALGPVNIIVSLDGRTRSGYQPYGGPANFFSTNEGSNELVLYPGQSVLTILHELGHAYNLRHAAAGNYAGVLLEPEMQGFLAAAGWRILTPADQIANLYDHSQVSMVNDGPQIWSVLSRDDALEDYANSFARFFANPGELNSLSPSRYAWFAAQFGY